MISVEPPGRWKMSPAAASSTLHPRPLVLTTLLAAFLLLPSMAGVGMFLDGLIYAAISRNLADGVGTFWTPHFSAGLFPVFREHPPLVFWLQSSFFRTLGDSYLTERAYDLALVVATALLLRALWRRLVDAAGRPELAGYWWLALLCWALVPKWSWAYRSNVLENTMTLFCVGAVLLVLPALRSGSNGRALAWGLLAGGSLLLGFLAKGLPALFVLVAPLSLALALRGVGPARAGGVAVVTLIGATGPFALLLSSEPAARELFGAWWQHQVAGRAGLHHGGAMLAELAKKVVPMIVVLLAAALAVRRPVRSGWWRAVLAPAASMLLIALSASVPLVLGDRDSGHYLLPSLPFYALGFGLLAAGLLAAGGERIRSGLACRPGKVFIGVAAAAAMGIVVMCAGRVGEVRKNAAYHALFERVAAVTGPGATLAIGSDLYDDWLLHAVAQRYYRIDVVFGAPAAWRLLRSGDAARDGGRAVTVGPWALERMPERGRPDPEES